MDRMTTEELRSLVQQRTGPCVSLYMPTHDAGADIQQDAIRFKNLLREAEERLRSRGMKQQEIDGVLAEARKLIDLDRIFWRSPKAGFAMFAAPGFFAHYHIPVKPTERVHVNDRFYVKPMLKLAAGDGRFYILALSQDAIRLLEATRYSVRQCDMKNIPTNLDEALQHEEFEAVQLRNPNMGPSNAGGRPGAYFAHSAGDDQSEIRKGEIRDYFRIVDRGLHELLGENNAPIILAGVNYLLPMYREVATSAYLASDGVAGNPEMLSNDELHAQCLPIAREILLNSEREAVAKFQNLSGGPKSSIDLKEILSAAHAGRVETVFVADDTECWGSYDIDSDAMALSSTEDLHNSDLLDLAATQTFATGGRVYVVGAAAVPGGEPVAAVFRF